MFFSPVCFLPWRAAWPEVVKVSEQLYFCACGHGYFFLTGFALLLEALLSDVDEAGATAVVGEVTLIGDGWIRSVA